MKLKDLKHNPSGRKSYAKGVGHPLTNNILLAVTESSPRWQSFIKERAHVASNGCWIWLNYIAKSGYGQAHVNGKPVRAHRLSHWAYKGAVEASQVVMHTCHNKACVNPEHLKAGSIRENIIDAMNVGSWRIIPKEKAIHRGESHGRSKLNESQVLEIKKKLLSGQSKRSLSKEYSISRLVILRISEGKLWSHV